MVSYVTYVSASLCIALGLYLSKKWSYGSTQAYPYPPGPKGLPILGNLLDMMATRDCKALQSLRDTYGPIAHLKVFGRSYIYLNDYKTMVDLFEKRGNIYSSRPHLVMNDLQGWNEWSITVLPYGPELRRSRQKLHQFLQQSAVLDYYPFLKQSSCRLAELLLRSPSDFMDAVKLSAADLITRVTYVIGIDDPIVTTAEEGMKAFSDAQGFYLVNEIPWLQYLPSWLPGMNFLQIAKDGYKKSMAMYKNPYKMFKKNLEMGMGHSSISARLLESLREKNGEVSQDDEEFAAKVTSNIYAGGSDATVSALLTFILAMVLNPEVQRKVQEEVDNVVGINSLPTFADLPKLNYINAIRKECLRWQSVVATPAPHIVTRDDAFHGAILRDPVEYPDPDKFIPERFILEEDKRSPLDPGKIVFSDPFDRICPGKYFAENSLFINLAIILSTCNIEKVVDNHGNRISPDVEYTKQLIRHPMPFKCSITLRNNDSLKLLRQVIDSGMSPEN
ncbi:cytochrome P450 [Pyrrhoderma noxium]|uniref:Cytochrome P450 n=1 Tax=Pyrrhoderma noxium TaxID=2282107 RepID=A0A286U6W6_9AGAM|nr:cytochrome P450 [Pyrrhoderma noxium]